MSGQSDPTQVSVAAAPAAPAGPAAVETPAPVHALGVVLVVAGLLLTGWLRRRGVLTASWLQGTPRRMPAFGWPDLLAVVVLYVLGGNLAAGLIPGGSPQAISQLILQVGTFGPATGWILVRAWQMRDGFRRLGLFVRPSGLVSALCGLPVAWILSMAALLLAAAVNSLVGRETPGVQHELLALLQREPDGLTLVAISVSAVLIAPLVEELLTRGLLQTLILRTLGHRARWLAIGIASAGFTALHLGGVPVQALPGIFVLGLVFGALYERTGSLVPGILVHAAFNAINVAMVVAGAGGPPA